MSGAKSLMDCPASFTTFSNFAIRAAPSLAHFLRRPCIRPKAKGWLKHILGATSKCNPCCRCLPPAPPETGVGVFRNSGPGAPIWSRHRHRPAIGIRGADSRDHGQVSRRLDRHRCLPGKPTSSAVTLRSEAFLGGCAIQPRSVRHCCEAFLIAPPGRPGPVRDDDSQGLGLEVFAL